jgi:hypothetical protein
MASDWVGAIVRQKEVNMTTLSHEPSVLSRDRLIGASRELWTSLAIVAIWLFVLLDALFGPDIVATDAGGSTTTVPSVVVVALFALFGTIAVARYGYGTKQQDS